LKVNEGNLREWNDFDISRYSTMYRVATRDIRLIRVILRIAHIMHDGLVFFDNLVDTFHFSFGANNIQFDERVKNGVSRIDESGIIIAYPK
jgi:hypothetical protein